MTKPTGGQAFPRPGFEKIGNSPGDSYTKPREGMTLRDYFQSNIMNGFASKMPWDEIVSIADGTIGGKYYIEASKKLAEAMIAKRNKK